jgi:hypothetical protein
MPLRTLRWFILSWGLLANADAADRLKAVVPPEGQDHAEKLVESLAFACNNGDFMGVMSHFAPSYRQKIRGRMEDMFIKHQPRMEIRQVTLLSESEDKITFGVRYMWRDADKPEKVLASKVTARMIDGQWKLDGEVVKSMEQSASESPYSEAIERKVVPVAWDAFNPPVARISPNLEHLRGDIGIQPGMGCANGQCRR